jgi:hypothetical protein
VFVLLQWVIIRWPAIVTKHKPRCTEGNCNVHAMSHARHLTLSPSKKGFHEQGWDYLGLSITLLSNIHSYNHNETVTALKSLRLVGVVDFGALSSFGRFTILVAKKVICTFLQEVTNITKAATKGKRQIQEMFVLQRETVRQNNHQPVLGFFRAHTPGVWCPHGVVPCAHSNTSTPHVHLRI